MLLSLLIALPGVLVRWVILRRPVKRSTGAVIAGLVWLVLVSLYFYGGGEQTPVFTGLGALLLYFTLVAPKKDDVSYVHNALLAEYTLSLIELTPENFIAAQLKDAVIRTYRVSGFPDYSEESVAESFNRLSRIEQLIILAMAFSELGRPPILRQEQWMPVKGTVKLTHRRGLAVLDGGSSRPICGYKYPLGVDIKVERRQTFPLPDR